MNVGDELSKYGLNANNCVVIGSGILGALGIRPIRDLDFMVTEDIYERLVTQEHFTREMTHGREMAVKGMLEANTSWEILGKVQDFDSLYRESVVIGGVRYITLEVLLAAKKIWVKEDEVVRQKDVDDIQLMEAYLSRSKTS